MDYKQILDVDSIDPTIEIDLNHEGCKSNLRDALKHFLSPEFKNEARQLLVEGEEILPGVITNGREMLLEFFNNNPDAVIIPILYSGASLLSFLYHEELDPLIKEENIIFIRPYSSYREEKDAFIVGNLDELCIPGKKILFIESDVIEGKALKEMRELFLNRGFSSDDLYCYLAVGIGKHPYMWMINPILDTIDNILNNLE